MRELYSIDLTFSIEHHGIRGQKWGVRRYQNKDGTLTSAGKKREHMLDPIREAKRAKQTSQTGDPESQARKAKRMKALKVGAAVAGAGLATYGAYKGAKYIQGKRQNRGLKAMNDHLSKNTFREQGKYGWINGKNEYYYKTPGKMGMTKINGQGIGYADPKAIKTHNQIVKIQADDIYNRKTNTKFDKGLAKVVDAGDNVGKRVNSAVSKVRNTPESIRRKSLDIHSEKAMRAYKKEQDLASLRAIAAKNHGNKSAVKRHNLVGNKLAKYAYDQEMSKARTETTFQAAKHVAGNAVKQKRRKSGR